MNTGSQQTWDYDIIIWAISQINAKVEAGQTSPPATVNFRPYDILKTLGRDTGGKGYQALKAALARLQRTTVQTNLKEAGREYGAAFNLIADFGFEEDEQGRPIGMSLTLPRWVHKSLTKPGNVLAISPRYFDISSGLDRFLYRLTRRHAGKQSTGWAFTFRDLHGRSGSAQSYGDFARDLRKAITRDSLPEYRLAEVEGANGPTLSMIYDPLRADYRADKRFKRLVD